MIVYAFISSQLVAIPGFSRTYYQGGSSLSRDRSRATITINIPITYLDGGNMAANVFFINTICNVANSFDAKFENAL